MPRIDFLLPHGPEFSNIVCALLRTIPPDWDCLTGELHPGPQTDTRLLDPAEPTYTVSHGQAAWSGKAGEGPLDPYRAFSPDGLPRAVQFVFAGASGQVFDLVRAAKLAMHYVQLGYVGHLETVPRQVERRAPRAAVQFQLELWLEPNAARYCDVSVVQNPPMLRLCHDHLHGGNLPVLEPFLEAARRFTLLPIGE